MNELKIFRMSNGDMLIAEFVNSEGGVISVLNPFSLVEYEDGDNLVYRLDFWVPFDSKENLVTLNGDHVVAIVPPTEALTRYYTRVQTAMLQSGEDSELRYDDEDEDDFPPTTTKPMMH